jgi:hypothetical protein
MSSVQTVGVNHFLPVATKRAFTQAEQTVIDQALDRWLPEAFVPILRNYRTPLYKLMANPQKFASLIGHTIGMPASVGLATVLGGPVGVTIGILGGLLTGGLAFASQNNKNENFLDVWERTPTPETSDKFPTIRDLRSDPVQNQDLQLRIQANQEKRILNNAII